MGNPTQNHKKFWVTLFSLFLCSLTLLFFSKLFAQNPPLPPVEEVANKPPVVILLSVLKGNPDRGGGDLQQYRLKSGETVFVQINPSVESESKLSTDDLIYESRISKISDEIAQQIVAIEEKQKQFDEEIFPAERAPIEIERQTLEKQLKVMEQQRDALQSEQRVKEAEKRIEKSTMRPPKPRVAIGLTVQPVVEGEHLTFVVKPEGVKSNAEQTTVQTGFGRWIKIYGGDRETDPQAWVKAELTHAPGPGP